ncbi:hypothetical protein M9Y10_038108 [Tritrichomonas musculus]|uniref:Protein kinase domain-containing protein n=1 Tax=Tritrichomonas musculus TaxID=1915356 RepID=A0ABR2K9B9_9EUKA
MFSSFLEFNRIFEKNNFNIRNSNLDKIVKKFSFYYISSRFKFEQNQEIFQNLNESKLLIVDKPGKQMRGFDFNVLIIVFRNTILVLNENDIVLLQSIFQDKKELKICFLSNSKDFFDQHLKINYQVFHINANLQYEISQFNEKLIFNQPLNHSMKEIWKILKSSLSAYLITQSYSKINQNRFDNFSFFQKKNQKIENFDEDEYIILRTLGIGSIFKVELIYHIEKEELFALKVPHIIDDETNKLLEREIANYSQINHSLLPRFYGMTKKGKYPIIEFINGQILGNIKSIHLDYNDKITIIFELMLIIQYFHSKKFVFRDLKPSNIMIDENKTVVIIDFDRMINSSSKINKDDVTKNFTPEYSAPEINKGQISIENDIYSLGKVISFIMKSKEEEEEDNFSTKFPDIFDICKRCTNDNVKLRPSINDLICEFYLKFSSHINSYLFENDGQTAFNIGYLYFKGEHILRDIDKAIHFLSISAELNVLEGQKLLGSIFLLGLFVDIDIEKSIHFYSLAANQDDKEAQYYLGNIYCEKELHFDIDKSIHYLTLAAEQNELDAQYKLGTIYDDGKLIPRDIEKAIYFYTLASNQNDTRALSRLGFIYQYGDCVEININKAIQYYTAAADLNDPFSQVLLGYLYMDEKTGPFDINKSLHYFSLAANQNVPRAQLAIALFYLNGHYVTTDIDKGIHYLTLAANQNNAEAQFLLGIIYNDSELNKLDIQKSIYYLTLAANQNHAKAHNKLGSIYIEGIHVLRDVNKFIYHSTIAANLNEPCSQCSLGILYYEGFYVERDINKAIQFLTCSANNNYTYAMFFLGKIYLDHGYFENAIYYLDLAANRNDLNAQMQLAMIYFDGQYKDMNKAIYYLTLASGQNDINALNDLGALYYEGKYINRDINKAILYLSRAANLNDINAQYNLGIIYLDGQYIARDISRSIHYFSLAAKQNDTRAQLYLALIYITGEYVRVDVDKAINYLKLAADLNCSKANFILGLLYYKGNDIIKRDTAKAFHYLSIAANQNHPYAEFLIGTMYLFGEHVESDISKFIYYCTSAANKNESNSQYLLGIFYMKGEIVQKNVKKGLYYLTKSSENRNIRSHFALGYLYHEGKNVERNIDMSINFYKEASSFNDQFAKNNLGIIYKNGFDEERPKRIGNAIEYFNEAIRQKNDALSVYNLAHIYLYDESIENGLNKSIELLLSTWKYSFIYSRTLLCLALLKKHGNNLTNIKNEFSNYPEISDTFESSILEAIKYYQLNIESIFLAKFEYFRNIDFLYNIYCVPIVSQSINNEEKTHFESRKDLSDEFYEGFGIEI